MRTAGSSAGRNEKPSVPYDNQTQFTSIPSQFPRHESQRPGEMIPMQEQPRVVVRTIREGDPISYSDQYPDSSMRFVPIPVQVERTGSQQRHASPPYHSDPYYRQNNA